MAFETRKYQQKIVLAKWNVYWEQNFWGDGKISDPRTHLIHLYSFILYSDVNSRLLQNINSQKMVKKLKKKNCVYYNIADKTIGLLRPGVIFCDIKQYN